MGRIFLVLSLIIFSNYSMAVVLSFDDRAPGIISDAYGGLDWHGFSLYPLNTCSGGYCNQGSSGTWFAFNIDGAPSSISGDPFDFSGGFFGGAYRDGLQINVKGLVPDGVKYEKTIVVGTDESKWIDFSFSGINELQFTSFGGVDAGFGGAGTHFTLDDFTFNFLVSSIPEPSSLAVLLLGLAFVAGANRRLRRKP